MFITIMHIVSSRISPIYLHTQSLVSDICYYMLSFILYVYLSNISGRGLLNVGPPIGKPQGSVDRRHYTSIG